MKWVKLGSNLLNGRSTKIARSYQEPGRRLPWPGQPMENTTALIQNDLDQFHAGDAAARERLFVHCQNRLRKLVRIMQRSMCASMKNETSNICQEVAIRLERALRNIQVNMANEFFRLTAFHIRFEIQERLRQYMRKPRVESLQLVHDHGHGSEPPDRSLLWEEIHNYIAQLPEEEQLLFDYLFYHGLSLHETSRQLDIPLSTLRRRWIAIKVKLAERFSLEEPF